MTSAALVSDSVECSTRAQNVTCELPDICPRPLPHEPVHTWSFLLNSVTTNTLGDLHRTPSQLAQYNDWAARTRLKYGSVGNFVIQRRLQWTPIRHDPDGTPRFETICGDGKNPLADRRDYKILRNDWPYGIEEGITHLCVWMKGRVESGDEILNGEKTGRKGKLSKDSREIVSRYVEETFTTPLRQRGAVQGKGVAFDWEHNSNGGGDGVRVLWFKNWVELQSVRGIDHIHVLLRGASEDMIKAWLSES